jgi:Fe-S-cluster containining protein
MEPTELGGPDHDWREHACLRTQWVLAGLYGLRGVFAPTTDFRTTFWNGLAGDVLADRADRSTIAAIAAIRRADQPPWSPALHDALRATAQIAAAVRATALPPSLWALAQPAPAAHPTGQPAGDATGTCGDCAWRHTARGAERCRQADNARVDPAWPACMRYEAAAVVDCQTCGACCREAYHAVHVARRDPAVRKQPSFVVLRDSGQHEVRRDGDRCAALAGGPPTADAPDRATRYHCTIYDDRPRTCREFTLGSDHCLTARRRVGLSL